MHRSLDCITTGLQRISSSDYFAPNRRDHLVWTRENGESMHKVCSHTGNLAYRNSKLGKKRKKRQRRDSKEGMKTEGSKMGSKDRSPECLSIAEVT